jgi:hypothetical protein
VNSYSSTNVWDDGYPSGGNYWSDCRSRYPSAVENDGSGTWNKPYNIGSGNTDRYPLMAPFHTFGVGSWNGVAYSVSTVSNSTLSNFSFNATAKTLSFKVTGTSGTIGFCRVAVPKALMWCNASAYWTVTINGTLIKDCTITNDTSCTYVYFTYHHSTETIRIQSTGAVPEFQPLTLTPLTMILTLLGAMILKRRRNAKK